MEIDLGRRPDNAVEFLLLRAQAINSYAGLESSLCSLLATLLGADLESASIIFYQVVNTRSRNRILEQLIKKRFSEEYSAYFHGIPNTPNKRGLITLVNDLDSSRNEIIHWHTVNHIGGDSQDTLTSTLVLQPPASFFGRQDAMRTTSHLVEFIGKCDFVQRSINMFALYQRPLDILNDDFRDTWRDIFQRPCVYPPPDNHPLAVRA